MLKIKQTGSAILTSLFIMILVAIAATAMSLRLQIDINRTQLIQDIDVLKNSAEQGELLRINDLIKQGLTFKKNTSENIDPIQNSIKYLKADDINIKTHVIDLQSRFNLNNLNKSDQVKSFTLLLHNIEPKLTRENAFFISMFTQEWISKARPNVTNVTTQTYYQKLKVPYQPSHQKFNSVSEWRLVKDVSQSLFNKLSPYICAVQDKTLINLNTASKEILKTLAVGLTNKQANIIIKARGKKGFKTLSQALANADVKALKLDKKKLTLTSNYFLITSSATNNTNQLTLFTLVKRTIDKKGVKVSVLQQTINTL